MNNLIYLPKFHAGQKAYLHNGVGSCFLVKILDIYRYNEEWYYDVDASSYSRGMKLGYVSEKYLTKKSYQKPDCRYSTKTIQKLNE